MSAAVFSLSGATAIQLADGTWYTLAPDSLSVVQDPSFTDPLTDQLITLGDPWAQFTDGGGQAYAVPFRAVLAFKFPAPISSGGGTGGGGPL